MFSICRLSPSTASGNHTSAEMTILPCLQTKACDSVRGLQTGEELVPNVWDWDYISHYSRDVAKDLSAQHTADAQQLQSKYPQQPVQVQQGDADSSKGAATSKSFQERAGKLSNQILQCFLLSLLQDCAGQTWTHARHCCTREGWYDLQCRTVSLSYCLNVSLVRCSCSVASICACINLDLNFAGPLCIAIAAFCCCSSADDATSVEGLMSQQPCQATLHRLLHAIMLRC